VLSHELPLPHTMVALDVQGYGAASRTDFHRRAVHNGLNQALRRAFAAASVQWGSCEWQDGGDGALILIPPTTSKLVVLNQVVRHLTDEVREHNERSSDAAHIHLRLCLHAGEVSRTQYGVVGSGIILVNRLLNSAELRRVRSSSREPITLAVTDAFFHDVVKHHPSAEPERFQKLPFTGKEADSIAWVKDAASVDRSAAAAMPHDDFDLATSLVDALLEVPSMADEVSRRAVLDRLPRPIGSAVRYHPRTRLHVFEMVRTCQDYENGIDHLLAALRTLEGDSVPVLRAEAAARKWTNGKGNVG
jgi:effector-associated domain 2 (EAD2)-containing protein